MLQFCFIETKAFLNKIKFSVIPTNVKQIFLLSDLDIVQHPLSNVRDGPERVVGQVEGVQLRQGVGVRQQELKIVMV